LKPYAAQEQQVAQAEFISFSHRFGHVTDNVSKIGSGVSLPNPRLAEHTFLIAAHMHL
jgi:hypothetical protein